MVSSIWSCLPPCVLRAQTPRRTLTPGLLHVRIDVMQGLTDAQTNAGYLEG
jgi:hypothetical protein